jgi:hypothetical protein
MGGSISLLVARDQVPKPRNPSRHLSNSTICPCLELRFDNLEAPGEPGLQILTYTPEPGWPSSEKLLLLSSRATTQGRRLELDAPRRIGPNGSQHVRLGVGGYDLVRRRFHLVAGSSPTGPDQRGSLKYKEILRISVINKLDKTRARGTGCGEP